MMKGHIIIRWKSRGSATFIFSFLKNLKYKSNIGIDDMFTSFKEVLYEDSFALFEDTLPCLFFVSLSVSISTTLSLFSTNLTSYASSICSCPRFRVSILNIHKFV